MAAISQDETLPDRVPRPDPTVLTTAQLLRELSNLREIIEARLNGMDMAVQLLNANVTRVPTDTDRQIGHLKELHSERFAGVDKQFVERDIRSKAAEETTATAISAALLAADRAAAKSEVAMAEKLNSLAALVDRSIAALGDKVSDLGDRLNRSEASFAGMATQRNDSRQNIGVMVALAVLGASLVSLVIGLAVHFH
jgi:hypothetical protein